MFQDQILWNAFFSQASKMTKSWKNRKIKNDKILWFWLTFVVFLSPTIFKNTKKKKLHVYCRYPETCCFILLLNDSAQERWNQYWCLEMILWGGGVKEGKNYIDFEKFSGFCCLLFSISSTAAQGDKRRLYSEKFPDFILSSAGVKDG